MVHGQFLWIKVNIMICEMCKEAGDKSTVTPGGSSTTLMYCSPYYDEDGNYHHHDSNKTKTFYKCSKGHSWSETRGNSCWCGWKNS